MDSLASAHRRSAERNAIRRDLVREGAVKSSRKEKILEADAPR